MKELKDILSKGAGELAAEVPAAPVASADETATACPLCGGAGFVRRPRPVDDPRFGKAEPCECILAEADDARRSRLERISNIGSLARFRFDGLDPHGANGESPWFAAAMEAAEEFAREPKAWLVFSGPSGSGKTHLAAAIANARIDQGAAALFMVVPDLLDHLRAGYSTDDDELSYAPLFDQVRNAPLLILDDLDAANGTAWAQEKLYQVVNHRFNAQLPTVFTIRARPGQLDERLATRLSDRWLSRVIVLEGAAGGGYRQVGGMTRERLREMNFGNFVPRPGNATRAEADSVEAAQRVAADYADAPSGWLVLQGHNGCGKTHLAAAIANRALGNGQSVFFAVVPDLLDYLRASFAPGRDVPYDELFEQVRNADLLVLDDLGAHSSSPWAEEKLYQIVNYRTVSGLPTVVTTNLRPDELAKTHPRIHARIADPKAGTQVEITAAHFRLGRPSDRAPKGTGKVW